MRALFLLAIWVLTAGFEALDARPPDDAFIPAGDAALAASVTRPASGEPPFPAVVLIPGSGPVDRRSLVRFRDAAVAAGLAAVIYDKRGVGASTGVYQRFSVPGSDAMMRQLGADAAAVYAWLTAQPDIDPDRVGYLGVSQGGWVAPVAAVETGAAFLVIACGTPFSAGEEVYHAQLTGEGRTPLSRGAQRLADRRLRRYDGPRGFDPRSYWRALSAPTLWTFGAEDLVVPSRASDHYVRRRLRGHDRLTISGMGHCWRDAQTGAPMAGLGDVLRDWLLERRVLTARRD